MLTYDGRLVHDSCDRELWKKPCTKLQMYCSVAKFERADTRMKNALHLISFHTHTLGTNIFLGGSGLESRHRTPSHERSRISRFPIRIGSYTLRYYEMLERGWIGGRELVGMENDSFGRGGSFQHSASGK